jgi:hypothetical protein
VSTLPLFDAPVRPRVNPVVRELGRRERNKDRVLARLKQGPATTMDLILVGGARAVGRCWELRREGYVITVEHIDGGLFRYTLRSPSGA